MESYLDLLKERNKQTQDLNRNRLDEYQKALQADQAARAQENADLLNGKYDPKNSQPYSLKKLAGDTQTPTEEAQAKAPTQIQPPKRVQQPQASPFNTAATIGAYEATKGIGASAASSATPAVPQVVSINGAAPVPASMSLPFLPGAGVVAGTALVGKGLNDLIKGRTDNSTVGKASRIQTGITTGGLSEVGRFMGIGGGKNKDQQGRDSIRGNLKEGGFLDGDYNVSLADGSKFDIGRDGSEKLYNVNLDDPLAGEVIAMVDPLAELFSGGDSKLRSDFAGYLTNAALSNANGDLNAARANIEAFYKQSGLTKEFANQRVDEMLAAGQIDQQRADVYKAKLPQFNLPSEAGESSGSGGMPSFGGFGGITIKLPEQKTLPPPPPESNTDFSLFNLAQQNTQPQARGDVIFNNALKGILGGQNG